MGFFKPEDFERNDGKLLYSDSFNIAARANQWLSERGVRVYAEHYLGSWVDAKEQATPDGRCQNPTHQALLINIEELPKKKCTHEANWWKTDNGVSMVYEPICFKCKIKLKASWSPA